jgi:hypothetical protein
MATDPLATRQFIADRIKAKYSSHPFFFLDK